MGPENEKEMTIYHDGEPISFSAMPEIGLDATQAAEAINRISAAWGVVSMTLEMAADVITRLWGGIMASIAEAENFNRALNWAEANSRQMVNRYKRTKKKRTRKKYAKRIMSAYLAEIAHSGGVCPGGCPYNYAEPARYCRGCQFNKEDGP